MIAALDSDGLLELKLKKGTNKAQDFCDFLSSLKASVVQKRDYDPSDVILFMDNASIHVASTVKAKIKDLRLRILTNCPYCPELNPAEAFIKCHKELMKKQMGQMR